ncbi:MAG: 4'-phosphopantetheinyl transferase superfamily protein [bacterium]
MPLIFKESVPGIARAGVWHCTEPEEVFRSKIVLNPADEEILSGIRNTSRRLQWLGCRMVLFALSGNPEVRIRYDSFGKPGLLSSGSFISFTHSGSHAAAIVSDKTNTGIDLEKIREKIVRVADRFLSPDELSLISGKDRLEKLTLFWCAKEALYKLYGRPELDIKHDLCIESFTYLCHGEGELTGSMKIRERIFHIPVTWRKIGAYMLAWALDKQIR